MWSGVNRRQFPRVNYRCKIEIKGEGARPKITNAFTENVGVGGICVVVKEDLKMFRGVGLTIYLENGNDPVTCAGSVVWVVKKTDSRKRISFDTGIEFIDLKDADKSRVSEVIKKMSDSRT